VVDGNWGAHVTIPKFLLKEAGESSMSYIPVLYFVCVLQYVVVCCSILQCVYTSGVFYTPALHFVCVL